MAKATIDPLITLEYTHTSRGHPAIFESERVPRREQEANVRILSILFVLASLAVLAAVQGVAQEQSAGKSVSFDVASIKPGGDIFSTRPERSPGRFRWTTQLSYLIGYAYSMDFARISGTHLGAVYVLEATFDPATTDAQLRIMLQSLLADRFRLRAHRETTQADGYAIAIGKGGIKLKEAGSEPASRPRWCQQVSSTAEGYVWAVSTPSGAIEVRGCAASVSKLAETLGRNLGQPLWDQTGLQGTYDFDFQYSQDVSTGIQPDAPSLATALREDLGLSLQKQKGPVETLVVDSVEAPSGN